MKKILIVLAIITLFSCEREIEPNTMNFTIRKGLPMLRVNINGLNGFLLVDTGASTSILDSSVVNIYKFKVYRFIDMEVSGIGGAIGMYYTADVDLKYNDESMNVNFKSSNLRNVRNNLGVIGILGSDYLIKNEIIVDYKNKVLRKSNILD